MAIWQTAGKVRMTPKGVYSSSTAYEILDIVSNADQTISYIAKQAVPAGTALTNTTYWAVIADVTEALENADAAISYIGDSYSSSSTYAVGDYVIHDGGLYRCKTAISTAEAWTAAHWEQVSAMDEIQDVKDEVTDLKSALSQTNKRVDDFEAQFAGETTASGNVAHITKASTSENVKNLSVQITPLQSGSGTPSPSNVRSISGWTGVTVSKYKKNMLTLIADGKVPSINSGELINANGVRSDYIPANPDTRYSVKCSSTFTGDYANYIFFYDRNKKFLSYAGKNGTDELSATTPHDTAYIIVRYGNVSDLSRVNYAQLEISPLPTEYEPVTKANYVIDWNSVAGTVYGGVLNITTGELTVTHGYIASYSGQSINEPWISSKDAYVEGGTPSTGSQVVYPLTTPQTYNIDPVVVPQSEGINNYTANNVGSLTAVCITDSINVTLPDNVKNAILACFSNVAWKDDDGSTYYNDLASALNS